MPGVSVREVAVAAGSALLVGAGSEVPVGAAVPLTDPFSSSLHPERDARTAKTKINAANGKIRPPGPLLIVNLR
jgi:hypothetical protein